MSDRPEHSRRAELALALATALSLPLVAGGAWAQSGNSGNGDIQVNEYTTDSSGVPYRTRREDGEIVTIPGASRGAGAGQNN